MTDEEYQIRRKYENRNLMQELEWVSHYPPSGMSNQDRDFIRWLAMTAYDKINELEQTSVPVHDMELILHEVAKPQWISVKERLPEDMVDVLCYYEYFRYGNYNRMFRTIDRGHVFKGRWFGEAGEGHKNKVFAWMPLPEPPKEDE